MTECKTHILILDDDPEELELIQKAFNSSRITNYRVFTDVAEFFECFTDDVFLAIIDYNLAGITAKEVVEQIHDMNAARQTVSKCEIIVISGTTDIRIPIYFMNEKKADYFLRKEHGASFYEQLTVYAHKAIERQTKLDGDHKQLVNKKNEINRLIETNDG